MAGSNVANPGQATAGIPATGFRAFVIDKTAQGISAGFQQMTEAKLDHGDVLLRVTHSSVNYKDALAASSQGGVVRRFPCTGGIDLAGVVVSSAAPRFQPGDTVVATGYDLGVSHHGGYAEFALIPGGWLLPLPAGLSAHAAMGLGTAGFTAALAIHRMESNGLRPEYGPVLVTGATGGVGALAIDMLAGRGYEVVALTSKADQALWLKSLGAARVLLRSELPKFIKPLEKAVWAGGVDVLGGDTLAWLLSATKPNGVVASIGLAQSNALTTTVMPFILRGIALLGIDSVYTGFALRETVWARLAGDLRPRNLEKIVTSYPFADLPECFARLLAGNMTGRFVIEMSNSSETARNG